jgi:hypothetical protein
LLVFYVFLKFTNIAQRGAIWATQTQGVIQGFSTTFSFQITRPSKMCRTLKKLTTQNNIYTNCRTEGGDGFAFVIKGMNGPSDQAYYKKPSHKSQQWILNNETLWLEMIGQNGAGLGYSGLENALAIEFDTFSNGDIGKFNKP